MPRSYCIVHKARTPHARGLCIPCNPEALDAPKVDAESLDLLGPVWPRLTGEDRPRYIGSNEDRALYRATDPDTSKEAADKVDAVRLERLVVDAVRELGTATAHEVAEHTLLSLVTVSPRFAPLERKGLLRRTGERRDGRQVWALVEDNTEAAA